MTAQASADRDAAPGPVAPATIVRVLVRPLTKVLNPLMVRLAGRRFFPMAQIHHVGGRSGKAYVTPTSAHIRGDRCRRLRARQLIAEVRQALPGVAGRKNFMYGRAFFASTLLPVMPTPVARRFWELTNRIDYQDRDG